jgi:hypothetical protein
VPNLVVDFPIAQIRDLATRSRLALDRKRQAIQQTLGMVVKNLVLDAFNVKSHGGRGSDGISWRPDKPETVRNKRSAVIGVNTRQMLDSLTVTVGGAAAENPAVPDIVVAFTAPHAEYFDEDRQLLPDDLPDAWASAIEGPVRDWVQATVQVEVNATIGTQTGIAGLH